MPLTELKELVKTTRALVEAHRHKIREEDLLAAYIHLDSLRFYLEQDQQARAKAEMKRSMNYVKSLIPSREFDGINCVPHKRYIESWALDMREDVVHHFPQHDMRFTYGMLRKHWRARMYLKLKGYDHYILEVVILEDGDDFIVTAFDKKAKQKLFSQVECDPPCHWVCAAINAAYATLRHDFNAGIPCKK